MRKVREVLRLYHAAGLSIRAIARSLGAFPTTVGDYVRRAERQGLTWPLPGALDDAALQRRMLMSPTPPRRVCRWPQIAVPTTVHHWRFEGVKTGDYRPPMARLPSTIRAVGRLF